MAARIRASNAVAWADPEKRAARLAKARKTRERKKLEGAQNALTGVPKSEQHRRNATAAVTAVWRDPDKRAARLEKFRATWAAKRAAKSILREPLDIPAQELVG